MPSTKQFFIILFTLFFIMLNTGCSKNKTENQINYPASLENKTLFATYTYGKPTGAILKVSYKKTSFITQVLSNKTNKTNKAEKTNKKILTGNYQYRLTNSKKGIAKLLLYPNQTNFNGSTQELTFHFESANMANFTDKDLTTGVISGGILTLT